MNLRIHSYRGHLIIPCAYHGSKRWYVLRLAIDGTAYDEQSSHQCQTLHEAHEYIDMLKAGS